MQEESRIKPIRWLNPVFLCKELFFRVGSGEAFLIDIE